MCIVALFFCSPKTEDGPFVLSFLKLSSCCTVYRISVAASKPQNYGPHSTVCIQMPGQPRLVSVPSFFGLCILTLRKPIIQSLQTGQRSNARGRDRERSAWLVTRNWSHSHMAKTPIMKPAESVWSYRRTP